MAAAFFLKVEAIPALPKNLDLVVEVGGGGDCNWEAVGALEFLKEYVLCMAVDLECREEDI